MRVQFTGGLMQRLQRRAGKLELAARLQRDRAAAGDIGEAENGIALQDRLPAEKMTHSFEERANALRALIGNRPMTGEGKRQFLVFGADAKIRFRLAAVSEPLHELGARLDRSHVDLV